MHFNQKHAFTAAINQERGFIEQPSPIALLGGTYRNVKGLLYYKTMSLQSSLICHEVVAMILFLSETVYFPMFTARVEVIVEDIIR